MSTGTKSKFDRDQVVRRYAKRHYETDSGVERIFYLPTDAPSHEIRFLEVNRLISETTPLEPIDFGVDIGGADGHTLYVLDVTPRQWDAIRNRELSLPNGWTLKGSQELAKE